MQPNASELLGTVPLAPPVPGVDSNSVNLDSLLSTSKDTLHTTLAHPPGSLHDKSSESVRSAPLSVVSQTHVSDGLERGTHGDILAAAVPKSFHASNPSNDVAQSSETPPIAAGVARSEQAAVHQNEGVRTFSSIPASDSPRSVKEVHIDMGSSQVGDGATIAPVTDPSLHLRNSSTYHASSHLDNTSQSVVGTPHGSADGVCHRHRKQQPVPRCRDDGPSSLHHVISDQHSFRGRLRNNSLDLTRFLCGRSNQHDSFAHSVYPGKKEIEHRIMVAAHIRAAQSGRDMPPSQPRPKSPSAMPREVRMLTRDDLYSYVSFLSSPFIWFIFQFACRVTFISLLPVVVITQRGVPHYPFVSDIFASSSAILAASTHTGQSILTLVMFIKSALIWLPLAIACTSAKLYNNIAVFFVVYFIVLFLMSLFLTGVERRYALILFNISMIALLGNRTYLLFPVRIFCDWGIGVCFAVASTLIPYPILATTVSVKIVEEMYVNIELGFTTAVSSFWAESHADRALLVVRIRFIMELLNQLLARFSTFEAFAQFEIPFFNTVTQHDLRGVKVKLLLELKLNLSALQYVIEQVLRQQNLLGPQRRYKQLRMGLLNDLTSFTTAVERLLEAIKTAKTHADIRRAAPFFDAVAYSAQALQTSFYGQQQLHLCSGGANLIHETRPRNVVYPLCPNGVDGMEGAGASFCAADEQTPRQWVRNHSSCVMFAMFTIVNVYSIFGDFQKAVLAREHARNRNVCCKLIRVVVLMAHWIYDQFVYAVHLVYMIVARRCKPEVRILIEAFNLSLAMLASLIFFYYNGFLLLLLTGPTIIASISGANPVETVRSSATRLSGTLLGSVFSYFAASYCDSGAQRAVAICFLTFFLSLPRPGHSIGPACTSCNFVALTSLRLIRQTPDVALVRLQQNTFAILIFCFISLVIFPISPSSLLVHRRVAVLSHLHRCLRLITDMMEESAATYTRISSQLRSSTLPANMCACTSSCPAVSASSTPNPLPASSCAAASASPEACVAFSSLSCLPNAPSVAQPLHDTEPHRSSDCTEAELMCRERGHTSYEPHIPVCFGVSNSGSNGKGSGAWAHDRMTVSLQTRSMIGQYSFASRLNELLAEFEYFYHSPSVVQPACAGASPYAFVYGSMNASLLRANRIASGAPTSARPTMRADVCAASADCPTADTNPYATSLGNDLSPDQPRHPSGAFALSMPHIPRLFRRSDQAVSLVTSPSSISISKEEDMPVKALLAIVTMMINWTAEAAQVIFLTPDELHLIPTVYPVWTSRVVQTSVDRVCTLAYLLACSWKSIRVKGYLSHHAAHILHNLVPVMIDITLAMDMFVRLLAIYLRDPTPELADELTLRVLQLQALCHELYTRKERDIQTLLDDSVRRYHTARKEREAAEAAALALTLNAQIAVDTCSLDRANPASTSSSSNNNNDSHYKDNTDANVAKPHSDSSTTQAIDTTLPSPTSAAAAVCQNVTNDGGGQDVEGKVSVSQLCATRARPTAKPGRQLCSPPASETDSTDTTTQEEVVYSEIDESPRETGSEGPLNSTNAPVTAECGERCVHTMLSAMPSVPIPALSVLPKDDFATTSCACHVRMLPSHDAAADAGPTEGDGGEEGNGVCVADRGSILPSCTAHRPGVVVGNAGSNATLPCGLGQCKQRISAMPMANDYSAVSGGGGTDAATMLLTALTLPIELTELEGLDTFALALIELFAKMRTVLFGLQEISLSQEVQGRK